MSTITDARNEILNKLLDLAREGDVRAAKIYLDCTKEQAAKTDGPLGFEDALRMLREGTLLNEESDLDTLQ